MIDRITRQLTDVIDSSELEEEIILEVRNRINIRELAEVFVNQHFDDIMEELVEHLDEILLPF